jgi:hypothetical protein
VTVSNSAPTAPAIAISPSAPVDGDSLTCSVATAATDADGDSLTYTFEWDVGGVAYTGASGTATISTVPGSVVGPSETWTCAVTANDGSTTGPDVEASVTTPCATGDGETCPGLDCEDILNERPSASDGVYWIDPTGADAYEVYCDMTTDGGGWTLVMKAVNSNFAYASAVWTTTTLDNPTDLSLTSSGTAKYQSFNEVPFTEIRSSDNTVFATDVSQSFTATQSSARAMFAGGGTVLSTSASAYFNGRAPAFYQAWGCTELNRYGFNLYASLGCTYQRGSGGGLCDWNGGARWGNRTNQYYAADGGNLNGQGWGSYGCGDASRPSYDTGPSASYVYAITELMWVR